MSNPLLGSKISLISKKNIRYEGTLYSINEADATVALQNVRVFGTEGRETEDGIAVPASDQVHPYLLFRGQDIKDLHVHENAAAAPPAVPEPPVASSTSSKSSAEKSKPVSRSKESKSDGDAATAKSQERDASRTTSTKSKKQNADGDRTSNHKTQKQRMVGSGASLLHRKARGAVDGVEGPEDVKTDFDFQSKLAEFVKDNSEEDESENESALAYSKDDFFDSISCDVTDRQSGLDNRLRGAKERNLNTETFGATSLGMNRRYHGRGRGRGGRGRGRGRGGRGGRGRALSHTADS